MPMICGRSEADHGRCAKYGGGKREARGTSSDLFHMLDSSLVVYTT